MIAGTLPPGTRRGRVARAFVRALRCLHPIASQRGDWGEAIEALTGRYPYRHWLRSQRRRRSLGGGPAPRDVGICCGASDDDLFEPDATKLIAAALDGGAAAVVFHSDVAGDPATLRIVATPGPVSTHLGIWSDQLVPCRPRAHDRGAQTSVGWREMARVDELLVHRAPTTSGTQEAVPGVPTDGLRPGRSRIPSPASEEIAVIVPSPGSTELLARFLEGLSSEERVGEIVVVDNSIADRRLDEFYRMWQDRLPLQVLRTDPGISFNYSRANNLGAAASVSPVLAFCNDDLEFVTHPTLSRLAGWLSVPDVGVAGPQLRYPDGTIQHGGVVLGLNGLAEHAFTGMRPGSETLIGNTDEPRDVSAVTGACLVTARSTFELVGGFDEELVLTGSDVWFCLSAAERGAHCVYDGTVALIHHESSTRGPTNPISDVVASASRWGPMIDAGDPYWSQLLSVNRHEPTLRRRGDPTSREMLDDHLRRHGVGC